MSHETITPTHLNSLPLDLKKTILKHAILNLQDQVNLGFINREWHNLFKKTSQQLIKTDAIKKLKNNGLLMILLQEAATESTNRNRLRAINQQWNDVHRCEYSNSMPRSSNFLKNPNPPALEKISNMFRTLYLDPDIVMTAVSQNGLSIGYTSPANQNDFDVALAAVQNDGYALHYVSRELQENPLIVKAAVIKNGCALGFAHPKFRNDFDIVLAAVKQKGLALRFASQELRNQRDIVKAAVQEDGYALKFAGKVLRNNPEIVLCAVKQFGTSIVFGNRTFRQDREIALAAICQTAEAIPYISPELLADKTFMLTALKQNNQLVEYFNSHFQSELKTALLEH